MRKRDVFTDKKLMKEVSFLVQEEMIQSVRSWAEVRVTTRVIIQLYCREGVDKNNPGHTAHKKQKK